MTAKQIEARMSAEQKKTAIRFETARKIRELFDVARREYGAEEYDGDDIESGILELVTEEA